MISLLPLLSEKDELAPDLQRAARYIGAHLDDPLTIDDVAAAAGVAGRTLHKHFHDEHGTSPMRYVRDCRFTQVRQALLQASPQDSVTTIAVHWGFCHLGRFSVDTASATAKRRRRPCAAGVVSVLPDRGPPGPHLNR